MKALLLVLIFCAGCQTRESKEERWQRICGQADEISEHVVQMKKDLHR